MDLIAATRVEGGHVFVKPLPPILMDPLRLYIFYDLVSLESYENSVIFWPYESNSGDFDFPAEWQYLKEAS